MAVKLQTIKDIRNYLLKELSELYSENESTAITNLIIIKTFKFQSLSEIFLNTSQHPGPEQVKEILEYSRLLKTGKPVQYILGETLFLNCILKVRPGILIPRPETEELAQLVIRENQGYNGIITDIGTGSGALAIALARKLPDAKVIAVDVSEKAIETAKENAALNNVRITFITGDILKPDLDIGHTGIIVSNPPYVRLSEKVLMHKNILEHEPHEALFVPDNDPLKFYKAILKTARFTPGKPGIIYFEINEAFGREISELLFSFRYRDIKIIKDINGKDRIVKAISHE